MRRQWFVGLIAVVLWSLVSLPAKAQITLSFDENGNGILNGAPDPGVLAPDPSNGGALALTYFLGGNLVGNGDVGVLDPDGVTLSDAIRFTDDAGNLNGISADRLIFYSDNDDVDSPSNLADTGFPANLFSGAVGGPVTENADGSFVYNIGNMYLGFSDSDAAVPEPGSLALVGAGMSSGLLLLRRRRR